MTLFAAMLPLAARTDLVLLIEVAFWLYVPASFIVVANYVTKEYEAGRLLKSGRTPLAFAIPPAGQWLFVVNILFLLVMQSIVYQAVITTGLLVLWAVEKRAGRDRLIMPQAAGWLFVLNVLFLLFTQSPLFMLLIVAGLTFLVLEEARTPNEQFGLERMPVLKLLRWALLICGAVILIEVPLTQIMDVILTTLHVPHPEQESVEAFRRYNRPSEIFDFLVLAVFVSPLLEELFFRGFLFTFLKNYTSTWMALILSAGVFAFAHANLGSALPLWLLGMVLGLAYQHTGSLLLPMCIHGCFNLMTAVGLLLDKGSS